MRNEQTDYDHGRARGVNDWKVGEYVICKPSWWPDAMWRGYQDGLRSV